MQRIWAERALTAAGWKRAVTISVSAEGCIDATAAEALHRAVPIWRHKVPDPTYDSLAASGMPEAGAVHHPLSSLVDEIHESVALLTNEIRATAL